MKRLIRQLTPEPLWSRSGSLRRAVREAPTLAENKSIFVIRRMAGHKGELHFFPALPRPLATTAIFKICMQLGWSMRGGRSGSGITIFWPLTEAPDSEPHRGLINGRCININKSAVAEIFSRVFGYNYAVDPTNFAAPYVRKSDINARHDGIVLHRPTAPLPNYVYQRLINNEVGDGTVEDLRLIYMRGLLPFLYRKLRPLPSRFSNLNSSVSVLPTSQFISKAEADRIEALSREIGLDYGEIDMLRDRDDGLLYAVDVNRTPAGPPNGLPRHEGRRALKRMAAAFSETFSAPIPCT